MKPVIPKIKVGEILRGTRNLRHWLRLASIRQSCKQQRAFGRPMDNKPLYPARKGDDFVVAANNNGNFVVWNPQHHITLLSLVPPGMRPGFSPASFAFWFSRTGRFLPSLDDWPNYAYFLWGLIHMNVAGLTSPGALPEDLYLRLTGDPLLDTFTLHDRLTCPRDQVRRLVHEAIRRGLTRSKARLASFPYRPGPHPEDFVHLEREIARESMTSLRELKEAIHKTALRTPRLKKILDL